MLHPFDLLFPPRVDEVTLRNVSAEDFLALMTPSLVSETRPETVVLLPFGQPVVRAALHEAKYHGSRRAFTLLAQVLAEHLRDTDDVGRTTSHIYLVPVPLGHKRQKERGFNQVEEVVRRALRILGEDGEKFSVALLLERVRETASQVSLPREKREENMRNAFRTRQKVDPAATYIIIDDVLTTGATLQAAVDAFKDTGATQIIPLALAH